MPPSCALLARSRGHEIVGRVTKVGSAVSKFKLGDLAAVGCMVDSDRVCPECQAGLEQFCPNMTSPTTLPTSSWVVSPTAAVEQILAKIREQATARYHVQAVVKRYMECVEEVVNIQELMARYDAVLRSGHGDNVIKEIVSHSRVEFNVQAEDDEASALADSDDEE